MRTLIQENRLKTDVLIIGGGLAGCFAAMKAMENGVKVTLVEKGHVAHSGSNASGIDHFPYCYIPEVHGPLGYKIEDFVKNETLIATGVINQELCEMMWRDSYDRLLDLEKTGIKIRFEKIFPWNFGFEPGDYPDDPKFRIVPWRGFKIPAALNIEGRFIKAKLNSRLIELGVNVLHYHDTQDLLVHDGSVVGAIGFNMKTGDFFVIEAKAIVLATGSLSRLFSQPVMFNHLVPPNQTAEGQTMALRAGAELAVMEQYPWLGMRVQLGAQRLKNWVRSSPATPSGYPAGRIVNAEGEVMPSKDRDFDQSIDQETIKKQFEWVKTSIREKKTPFYWDATAATDEERSYAEWSCAEEGGGIELFRHLKQELNTDLSTHQIELGKPRLYEPGQAMGFSLTSPSGLIINEKTETTLKALYAAGEVAYGQHFPSSPWAFVTGARAGHNAAEYALRVPESEVDEKQVEIKKERIYAPFMAYEGVTWQELNLGISNIMGSYFFGASPNSIKMGLQYIEDLKKQKPQADNPHELMRCMETLSLLVVSEIFLRASLSPRKPDEWRILKQIKRKMSFTTSPIKYKYPQSN